MCLRRIILFGTLFLQSYSTVNQTILAWAPAPSSAKSAANFNADGAELVSAEQEKENCSEPSYK
jgi:hypothetical protein